MTISSGSTEEMFRPPLNRGMQLLDRSLFKKTILISAAKVVDRKRIKDFRTTLNHDLLRLDRFQTVQNILEPNGEQSKALLLNQSIYPSDDIMCSILPEDEHDNIPTGFSVVGHVVHLNLRSEHLPYKHLIATLLLDKVPSARSIINKIDDVGSGNAFRTFNYELLAGDPDLNVEVNEEGCLFTFDYSKVYWNSRLNTEHRRIVQQFKPGEAICDVMAGVGPFALPAGRKRCWVMANDLNPASFDSLAGGIQRNKVQNFVKAHKEDGNSFVRSSTMQLLNEDVEIDVTPSRPRHSRDDAASKLVKKQVMRRPRVFSHYVLNLPASALTFLPSFVGVYAGYERLFSPHTDTELPLVHVYCFNTKSDNVEEVEHDICREISQQIGHDMHPESEGEKEGSVSIWDVRDVAPNKRMFCASFRLPEKVAYGHF
ncbi:uncharacterized protein KY384_004132 [Bacidia gigantensis]|uniref:uncharacterized protein n=1 Tax=Bacidia gigantensis TaxID=2732470 RepID=UPI001D042145|nr:uncharacterized protein KY384_004132 [Bacidia gigantensis]KAG8530775.1 hypothetical protein KY384_004132 [Bacidia gigantensis]